MVGGAFDSWDRAGGVATTAVTHATAASGRISLIEDLFVEMDRRKFGLRGSEGGCFEP